MLRRLLHRFKRIEDDIAEFERGAWRSAAGVPDPGLVSEADAGVLRRLLPQAEATYRRTGRQLAELGQTARDEQ
jgi:hypothetical protein